MTRAAMTGAIVNTRNPTALGSRNRAAAGASLCLLRRRAAACHRRRCSSQGHVRRGGPLDGFLGRPRPAGYWAGRLSARAF